MKIPVRPGDVLLNKYRVESVLGQGGMGLVVAARHIDLGELFAIKFLLPDALESPDAVDRFLREARASARLKGEHVAKVHDVGRLETGTPYMVMEHLVGSDLKAVLRARGPLPAEEATALVLQACEAVAEAHAAGIIHRDLKPANLFLIQRPNGTPCVKVLDFGISKQVTPDAIDLTKSGMIMGSPPYMPPEQITDMKSADARSDVWSLGIVLYQLVTGKTPFAAETITGVVARVLHQDPLAPSRMRAGVPPALDGIVERCLQKNREHRFQSIGELVSALQSMVGLRAASTIALSPVDRAQQLGAALQPDAAPQLGAALQPDAAPEQASHLYATTVRLSRLYPAPAQAPHPSALPMRTSITISTWGQTGARSRAATGAARAVVVTVAVLSCATVVMASRLLMQQPSQGPAPPSQVPDTAATTSAEGNEPVQIPSAHPNASAEPSAVPTAPTADPGSTNPPGAGGSFTAVPPPKPVVPPPLIKPAPKKPPNAPIPQMIIRDPN